MEHTQLQASEIVRNFIQALNEEDFETARALVTEDLIFKGVMGERSGAEAYFNDMEKMKLKYRIQKVFVADPENVCLAYDIDMGNDLTVFSFGWYRLREEKIQNIRVVFDPRPLLEQ
ncbi:nuclear transport factor 2 family protein [Pedobacter sp. JY14-1]|uniref:nuclear transport factor 2 family protein n=1 Tax=Pedobacter sp. JY14-1 TaxID=3034151 RepID=UPI0023E30BC2|nr:nuclear transport factor 2 family protein [Pedobacter sp. JY14-1]